MNNKELDLNTSMYKFPIESVKEGAKAYDRLLIEAQKALKNKPPMRKYEPRRRYRDD